MSCVVAVVITRERPRELARLLAALEAQARRPDLVLVVENGRHPATAEVLRGHPEAEHIGSERNLGGAGGFAFGILAALARGASHVWVMDDDGLPERPDCLASLLASAEASDGDIVSPIVVDITDPDKLSFPYYLGLRRLRRRADLAGLDRIERFAHLFNGALLSAAAFERFGVPDPRLFIRGDEVDFLHRVRRGGGRILTLTGTAFRHPSGQPETEAILGGYLNAVCPEGELKQFYFFRNRGYLVREHRLLLQLCSDLVRYPVFYLLNRRGDWRGLLRWGRLTWRGISGDFTPFTPAEDAAAGALHGARSVAAALPR